MTASDALRPLIEAIKAEVLPAVRAEIMAEVRAELAGKQTDDGKVLLSLADLAHRYGCGRKEALRLIEEGRLASTQRRCRGGKLGNFIHVADAERVLAGRKAVR